MQSDTLAGDSVWHYALRFQTTGLFERVFPMRDSLDSYFTKPDKYYARIILDLNRNGEWDTGNYAEKRQPEEVFYSPKVYNILQNFQIEETWNVYATPWLRQKPLDITKNKPKEVTKKKRDYREEGRTSSRNSSSNGLGGFSL